MRKTQSEEQLELAISLILIIGVIASVALETIGIVTYYHSSGNMNIIFQPEYAIKGQDFFGYARGLLLQSWHGTWTPFLILSLGIVILMTTPYIRVLASVIYFALIKNTKYFLITLFVLVVLTASLLVH